jgi:phospholipid/cholesterol/gamma-HCH transport system ATP-binding protein
MIEVKDLWTSFGEQQIHKGISFKIPDGKITAIIGGSGSGKTTLLRVLLGLLKPDRGSVNLMGVDILHASEESLMALRIRMGVLFQQGALFSALTVSQNVAVPITERFSIPKDLLEELVMLRLHMVGLHAEDGEKYPSELSGGMKKRAALARAISLEPQLLFLDEPTSGLDPVGARAFDHLIRELTDALKLTVCIITHDLDTIESVVDHVLVLFDGGLLASGGVEEIKKNQHPWIQEYFAARYQSP